MLKLSRLILLAGVIACQNAKAARNISCAHLQEQENNGMFNYLHLIECTWIKQVPFLGFILLGIVIVFLMYMLLSTADCFFCPSLQAIVEYFKLSPNVAGVTFLSFGNGSNDVFSNIAAFSGGNEKLGFAGLLGGGLFITTVVAGSVGLASLHQSPLHIGSFLRDAGFYLLGVVYLLLIYLSGKVNFIESLGFSGIYLAFVLVVIYNSYFSNVSTDPIVPRAIEESSTTFENDETTALVEPITETQSLPIIPTQKQKKSRRTSACSLPAKFSDSDDDNDESYNDGTATISEEYQLPIAVDREQIMLERPRYTKIQSYGATSWYHIKPVRNVHPTVLSFRERGKRWTRLYYHEDDEDNSSASPLSIISDQMDETPTWLNRLECIFNLFWHPLRYISMLLRLLTIPVVDPVEWNQKFAVANPFFVIATIVYMSTGKFPWEQSFFVGLLLIGLTLLCSFFVWKTTVPYAPPLGWRILPYVLVAFVMSVSWIMIVAQELLAILETMGIFLGISNAVLGMTVLAWGNEMGDLLADTAIAKDGFAMMAFAGCFAGPMYNLLIGFGIPFCIASFRDDYFHFDNDSPIVMITIVFLIISLIANMVFVVYTKGMYTRKFCYSLFLLYAIYIVTCLLSETLYGE